MKARLCVAGASRMATFCEEHGVPFERCGKLIVAATRRNFPARHARGTGPYQRRSGLRRLAAEEIREVEPHCVGVAAFHSPARGSWTSARSPEDWPTTSVRRRHTRARNESWMFVTGRTRSSSPFGAACLRTERSLLRGCLGRPPRRESRGRVECADRPVPGRLSAVEASRNRLVRGLIYPVPDPALPFLGVHLTRHAGGGVWLGPTALLVGARDAYAVHRIRSRDIAETLVWPGTWRMMRRYWRSGVEEVSQP